MIPIPSPAKMSSNPPQASHDGWTREKARLSAADGTLAAAVLPELGTVSESEPGPDAAASDEPESVTLSDSESEALRLVERRGPGFPSQDIAGEMRERFALGDFTAALRAAEMILGQDPGHHEATQTRITSRERLEHLYRSRLGRDDAVPVVIVPEAEVRWLGLDHQAAYLLSRIDSQITLEQLLDICGMDRLEALKALALLVESRAIELR